MDRTQFGGALVALLFLASPAAADIAVVAVDNHTVNVNGVTGPAKNPPSDHVAIVNVAAFPPKLVGTVEAPTSVVGAPTAIARRRHHHGGRHSARSRPFRCAVAAMSWPTSLSRLNWEA